jgi:signal transduction histidine kinase
MVRNLLDNARRHGGTAPVSVVLELVSQATIQLEVTDCGAGVPEAEREKIFTPFYRAGGASEDSGGHGLGLSLVQQIARHHGGNVCCIEGNVGGACFRVVLPGSTRS